MNREEIIEGNKLISEFMGLRSFEDDRYGKMWTNPVDKGSCFTLQYHSSWDWLMPVVEKLESLGYGFTVDPWGMEVIEYLSGEEELIIKIQKDEETKLEQYYYCVLETIKWYNSNK